MPKLPRTNRLFDGLLAAGAVLLFCLLIGPVSAIGRRIPLNYNEGWNAYFALRAVTPGAGPLYPPHGALVFNNYPPLSFYLVGALGRFLFGDMILAGRVVALAALLACGPLLALAVRRLGGSWRAAAAAGLLLPLFACTFFRDYVAMDDPQWLAHALMLGGFAVLLRKHPPAAHDVVAAAMLMLAGGLVKHNLVALPLALTLWLALYHRRAALPWLATATLGLAGAAGLALAAYGPVAFGDVFGHARVLQPSGMLKGAGRLLPLLPMAALAVLLLHRLRQPAVRLATLFATIACATGILQRAGAGVAINAQFETLVATCLAAGLALDRAGARRGAALAVMALPILVVLPKRLNNAWADLAQAPARAAAWQPMIARIAAAPGPAACETLALCYWAGKPFTLDLFNLTQSVLARGANPRFQQMARQRAFDVVEVTPGSPVHLRPDPILREITPGYAAALAGPQGSLLLVRRPSATMAASP
jgi:hypothetical protein